MARAQIGASRRRLPPRRYGVIHGNAWDIDCVALLRIALDAAKGLAFLHGRAPPVVHRDVKSPNVLISQDWVGKIGDFGLSESSRNAERRSRTDAASNAGGEVDVSPMWAPPEALRGEAQLPSADVFALATVVCVRGARTPA